MSATLKILVTVILLGLCLAGYSMMDYQAKLTELDQLQTQIAAAEQRLADNRAKLARLPELTAREQKLEAELASLIRMPGDDDPEQFVSAYLKDLEHLVLTQQAASGDDSFNIQSVTPGQASAEPPADENQALEGAPRRVFEMSFQGRYQTLADFLVELGQLRLDRLVTINKIVLAPASTKEPGVLQIQMPVTAYLRQGG
jgi:Tfp pilus assembly protein PilO